MQKKRNTKFKASDYFIIFFCLAGALASGIFFWKEYNNTLYKLNEEPAGTIVFKKRTAQRRFIDRGVWDRLKKASPLYSGDTIRTVEQSSAVIIFDDEITYLNLDESTMIQVFHEKRTGTKIDLSEGNLEVDSENKNIVISSGSSAVVVDGQARMNKSEEGFILSVLKGQADFNGTQINTGNILAIDAEGQINTSPMIFMTSLGSSAYILGTPAAAVPVNFSWNEFNFTDDTRVIIDVCTDSGFSRIVETRNVSEISSISIPLGCGNYWWRAYPVTGEGRVTANWLHPSGRIEVIPSARPKLLSPSPAQELAFSGKALVPFSWSAAQDVCTYLLEISSQADMENPVVSRQTEENSVIYPGLEQGHWYWRITPVFPSWVKGSVSPSAVGEFSVTQRTPVLAAPALTHPLQDEKVNPYSSACRLLWVHDPNASSWFVELADNSGMVNPMVKQNVTKNYFQLSPELLKEGKTWYWRVTALGGLDPVVSSVRNFEVTSENRNAARPVTVPILPPVVFGRKTENWDDLDAERASGNEKTLSGLVIFLNTYSEYRVHVEGFANSTVDPRDIAGRLNEQNLELRPMSEVRARTVAEKLVKRGVEPNRIEYSGLGGEKPVALWEDRDNWWKNRRVEFVLIK
ncbi:MAG: FecR domain-containing protein [Treponema sp.]|jgi:hypothetical protein|nr:FecR domain-containing protein [Treponema sp.]